jgi:SAM-dependent methyltransferase
MLEQLRRAVPEATALSGSAEAVPLPDASADAVVAAQAYHWFDQPIAVREIARILRPCGTLGLVWNMRDETVDWVARLSELIGSESDDGDEEDAVEESGLYGPVEEAEWRWEQPLDLARLLDLVLSRSYCATLPPAEREPVLGAVQRLYEDAGGPDGLAMPYVTYGFRAVRR